MQHRTTKLKILALLERILLGEILGVLGVLAVNAIPLFHRQDAKDAMKTPSRLVAAVLRRVNPLVQQLTCVLERSMVSHMKTTISIADDLFEKARSRARREDKTFREVVEEALRLHLARKESRNTFRLKRHTFKGEGLQPGIEEGNWEQLRDLIYGSG
jgi:hypothetical protein